MVEGGGVREEAGVGVGHVEVEEQLHFLVQPLQEELVWEKKTE